MFEITYDEKSFRSLISESENAQYDFTFENRFDIYHRPKKDKLEYIALDRTTGRTSFILENATPIRASEYPDMLTKIIYSIKYTGDERYKGACGYPASALIEIIFRVVMPQHGYAIREQQIEMAKSIYNGLCSKKATLCEAEVGTGKTMAYLVAGFVAKLFDDSYSFMGYPVTITTSSIELQKSILGNEFVCIVPERMRNYQEMDLEFQYAFWPTGIVGDLGGPIMMESRNQFKVVGYYTDPGNNRIYCPYRTMEAIHSNLRKTKVIEEIGAILKDNTKLAQFKEDAARWFARPNPMGNKTPSEILSFWALRLGRERMEFTFEYTQRP